MFVKDAIESRTKGQRTAILAGKMAAVLSVPVLLYAFGTNPPLGNTGAPGEGTCSSCHGTLTSGSGVTVTLPSTTYTAGGAAVTWTVNIPATGGFELTTLAQSGNTQAGTLVAGGPPPGAAFPQDAVSTSGTKQYVFSTVENTSWTFSWVPPATSVGNVVVYVTGGTHGVNYSNSYVLTPGGTSPPPPPTLSAGSSPLTFTVNGATPPTQTVQITSSGAPIAFTTGVSTTSGGNWLTAIPSGGSTPLGVTVGVVAAGLTTGTFQGSVSITPTGAGISPLSIPVTVNVVTPVPPAIPTLHLSSLSLSFSAAVNGTASPQDVQVTTSDGSAVAFTAGATTTSGGSWLAASPASGSRMTPGSEAVSVVLTGLTAGTYHGAVTFTSSAVSNSPVSLPVTLTVTSPTPSPASASRFSLVVVDRQSSGGDWMLLDGTGSVDSSGVATGSGFFTRFASRSSDDDGGSTSTTVVANGTWTVTGFTSFTPAGGGGSGGVLVLQVQISTQGGTSSNGTMTISSTGSVSGVTLSISGGSTFAPSGIGRVSVTSRGGEGGGGGGGGGSGSIDN